MNNLTVTATSHRKNSLQIMVFVNCQLQIQAFSIFRQLEQPCMSNTPGTKTSRFWLVSQLQMPSKACDVRQAHAHHTLQAAGPGGLLSPSNKCP